MWAFATDPDYQTQLDWVSQFVRDEVEPIDLLVPVPYDMRSPVRQALIPPLQQQVREHGLWAAHLGPHLGGPGYGQLKLALLNEILGRSHCAPTVFGCQAPDSGNAEILAHFGSAELKRDYLEPLLRNDIVSCFSMTEPQGGADPLQFIVSAVRDGDEWVLNGEKWFSSNARYAAFLVVLAVTDPNAEPHRRMSMFVVPADTPGIEIIRNVGLSYHTPEESTHGYVRYTDVRIPASNILGEPGDGFVVAQTRLGGGRIHHAMRSIGQMTKAFEMMCERALSRRTKGETLADKQLVQAMIADSWTDIQMFRLLVLQTAWKIDQYNDYKAVRADISAVKAALPRLYHDVAARALQIHGSLGVSNEMPFGNMVIESFHMGLAEVSCLAD
jgi:acyl-CoA dehydrogenase